MTEDQHAVVDEADDRARPDTEDTDAREKETPTMDELLAHYEKTRDGEDKAKPDKASGDGDDDRMAKMERELEDLRKKDQEREYSQDLGKTVVAIRGDHDAEIFGDKLMEGWLTAESREDPRIARAWIDRENDPTRWSQIEAQLGKKFETWVGSIPDKRASEDRAAIADAVRGASKKAPDTDDVDRDKVMKMGDGEFETYVASLDKT